MCEECKKMEHYKVEKDDLEKLLKSSDEELQTLRMAYNELCEQSRQVKKELRQKDAKVQQLEAALQQQKDEEELQQKKAQLQQKIFIKNYLQNILSKF